MRRIATGAALCGSLLVAGSLRAQPLPPEALTRWLDPVPIPGAMPAVGKLRGGAYYEIGAAPITQQLHSELAPTPLWGYGPPDGAGGYDATYPARTVEAAPHQRVYVRWVNALVDAAGEPLEHLLPVDKTLHCGPAAPECEPEARIVTHVHGAHVADHSDGYPEAWFSPGFAEVGSHWEREIYEYSNDQPAATLWYHDHALGITRLNVYAGLAGFWILRDRNESRLGLPSGEYEIPLAMQDRSFNADGTLFYPAEPDDPTLPNPSIVPEFFGNVSVVNGKAWPYLEVEPRKYRFRLLNGCNARALSLQFFEYDEVVGEPIFSSPGPQLVQIGTDGGFLQRPVEIDGRLILVSGERADVIVDFSAFAGQTLLLHNDAKSPFKGPGQIEDEEPLPEIMLVRVGAGPVADPSRIPDRLTNIRRLPEASALQVRDKTLEEGEDDFGRLMLLLDGLAFHDAITETPMLGSTEIWRLINLTEDVHPIHLHLVQFQILDRQPVDAEEYLEALERHRSDPSTWPAPRLESYLLGERVPPPPNEQGWKDTVQAYPDEVTRIIARFDLPGLYVWHCHILEHEDHEMMRPYEVRRGHPGIEALMERGADTDLIRALLQLQGQ